MSQSMIDHGGSDRIHRDHVIVPLNAIRAACALLLFTVVVAGAARLTGHNHVVLAPTKAVSSRDLLFADRKDGGVVITDAGTGRLVTVIPPRTGGFLRGVMRGLVREHKIDEGTNGSPFRLTRWADGRLSIEDPANGERFELEAFGATNEAVFAALLTDGTASKGTDGSGAADAKPGARADAR